jgi:hypothetical protein
MGHVMTNPAQPTRWQDISPKDAAEQLIDCRTRPDLNPPVNENGEVCPWPWEPQQLVGVPLGQYRCDYCNAMCVAGMEHLDYSPTRHPLIGKTVLVTTARKGDPIDHDHPDVHLAADVSHLGELVSASYDGEAVIVSEAIGGRVSLWPALDITEVAP